MSSQVLFLFDGFEPNPTIVQHLSLHGLKIQTTSALAQAMNWIHATRSLFSSHGYENPMQERTRGDVFNMIVADVSAGGISLAEYALEQYETIGLRPVLVLLDDAGDVSAARRAIRLNVDAYLLKTEPDEFKLLALEQAVLQAQTHVQPAWSNGNTIPSLEGITLGYTAQFQPPAARLSTIENAIINCLSHSVGLPVSARSIVNTVMGRDLDEDKAASLLRPHISRLRSKLEPMPQMPQHLLTVRGKGYMVV